MIKVYGMSRADQCDFFYLHDYLVSPLTINGNFKAQLNWIIARKSCFLLFLIVHIWRFHEAREKISRNKLDEFDCLLTG